MRIKTILATACLLASNMTMVAQTSSFLGYRATIDGQKYFAKDITIGEKTVKIINADDTSTSFDISHGNKQTLQMKNALYCVKGTLTTDLVKKAAAENAIWFGAINNNDEYCICRNLNGYTSFSFEHLDVSSLSDMELFFANAYTLQTVYLPGASLNVKYAEWAFDQCSNLKYIDFSGWDSSSVIDNPIYFFQGCSSLTTIKAVGCSDATISFLRLKLSQAGLTDQVTIITTEE